jgi:hypothetical protein
MHVLGLRRRPAPSDLADEVLPPDRLHDLLARSDFVVIAVPLTAETRGMIGRAELAAMKPDAWLVNISRGAIVDEEALVEALQGWPHRRGMPGRLRRGAAPARKPPLGHAQRHHHPPQLLEFTPHRGAGDCPFSGEPAPVRGR